ncbi:Phosphatidylethanolamine N-methyltransferase [Rhizoctonia solani]|uniref:Phosphatidylethanolamine N-methyltransferase n=1 Tax=Rhizoctonia solani TaxID=456999 RepID=A0A0K6G3C9_9AGAM|nr:Phosphatidylethanolamine N-methyltransferase [Rhizoctonia solani]
MDFFVSPSIRIPFRKSFAFRDEVNDVRDKYNELSESPNHEHLEVWADQVELQVTQRQTFAAELRKFLSLLEDKRVEERRQRLASRRNEIKERLLALGWEEDDIESSPYIHERAKEWDKLVETPEDPSPLTDRIWKNLYAKLRPLLKASRQERLEYQSLQMQARRRECLDKFLKMIKNQERPLLKVKLRQPDSQALRRFNRPRVQHDVFPFVQDALDWPFIQALNERNLTIEEFRRELEQHRNKIEIHISKWQNKTRRFLVDLVWKEDTEPSDLLDPPKNMDRDAYAGLSDNQKVLLRADSLFYPEKAAGLATIRPYSYDEALRIISPSYRLYPNDPWDMKYYSEPESPELDSIHQHARAQEVARHLLKDLGKSNASFLEINQFLYTCQRCHDKEPMYWTEIIEHYLQQKHSFTRIKKQASALAQQGIIYRNVHAPGNKPMIRPCKPKKPVQANVWRCNLCAKKPMSLYVIAPKPNLYRHLLEVHAVPKHRLDLHYRISSSRLFWTDCDIRYIYWQEEGDELDKDNEEIEADNGPEQEREDKDVKSMDGEESSEGDDMAS